MTDIEQALHSALPASLHARIPVLAQVLAAARDGQDARVATPHLIEALKQLQGQTLTVANGSITVQNVSGETIAIGHGAQATTNIHLHVPRTAKARENWHNRCRMIEQVQDFWITGVLEKSLYQEVLIALGLHADPYALRSQTIHYKGMELSRTEEREPYALPPGTTIAQVFDKAHQRLLILGAPGGGKTTLLLDLARTLLARAQQDETYPIPVVFNLSSWAQQRQPLDQWLVQELREQYGVGKRLAKQWIQEHAILPLLDGLDEVAAPHRAACVAAINVYCREHSPDGLVVCSRLAEFRQVDTPLVLEAAVVLQPLDNAQTAAFFARAGASVANVQTMLHEHPELQRLARVPLMLHIITLAYGPEPDSAARTAAHPQRPDKESDSLNNYSSVFDVGTSADDTPLHDIRTRLFECYVQRMFERPGRTDTQRATQAQTIRWLAWLAGRIQAHSQTVFQIEQMQPQWLQHWWQRVLYVLLSMLFASVGGLILGPIGGLILGLVFGLVMEGGILLAMNTPNLLAYITEHSLPDVQGEGLSRGLFSVPSIGLLFSPLAGLVSSLVVCIGHIGGASHKQGYAIAYGLMGSGLAAFPWLLLSNDVSGLAIGLAFSSISVGLVSGLLVYQGHIKMTEGLRWSWSQLKKHWWAVPSIGLGVGLTSIELQTKACPNEGTWRSFRRAFAVYVVYDLAYGLVYGLVHGLSGGLVIGLAGGLVIGLSGGLVIGLVVTPAASLYFGGLAFAQHWAVRAVCTLSCLAPWRYARFLDYAVERIFLRRVGGSYIFVHRTLLEYFAELANSKQREVNGHTQGE